MIGSAGGSEAPTAHVERVEDLPTALHRLGVVRSRPVLVIVGGAAGFSDERSKALRPALLKAVFPVCESLGAAVVDGGTDAGVMSLAGTTRAEGDFAFPLIGVFAAGTVAGPAAVVDQPAELERHHTHFVSVPGDEWGDESPWLIRVAEAVAGDAPIAGLLVGGGEISVRDVQHLVQRSHPVLALAGSGGVADGLSRTGMSSDPRVEDLRVSELIQSIESAADPSRIERVIRAALTT